MSFGELFLRDPAAFPDERDAATLGDLELVVDLPAGLYRLRGLDAALLEVLETALEGFIVDQPRGEASPVWLYRASPARFLSFDTDGWEQTFDLGFDEDAVRLAGYHFLGRVPRDGSGAAALWLADDLDSVIFPVANFFRVLIANRLLETGGLLLHSSCVIDSGFAVLYVGPSGAGKSTIAKCATSAGLTVLGDDMNVARKSEDGWRVEEFPFAGEIRHHAMPRASHPLGGVYRLRKGEITELRDLSRAGAWACVTGSASFVNSDPYRDDRLHRNVMELENVLRVGELTVSRASSYEEIRQCLEAS